MRFYFSNRYDKEISMPRQTRIDAQRALHHIIFRRIERRKIFYPEIPDIHNDKIP
ncbi:hypothetical protein DESC_80009 [Desulfosarcina cetonica]|nr:hypothetical protein DESC_80009 [Desulfosarcina cetonica]